MFAPVDETEDDYTGSSVRLVAGQMVLNSRGEIKREKNYRRVERRTMTDRKKRSLPKRRENIKNTLSPFRHYRASR